MSAGRSSQKRRAKSSARDWHPVDVVAALWRHGWTLRKLSRRHGYASSTLKAALRRSYPRAEAVIARTIGLTPEIIWPDRCARRAARRRRKRRA